jgi:guanosine-3',5'-bis(diphosphate) 3'-pyrophosphohydrolase
MSARQVHPMLNRTLYLESLELNAALMNEILQQITTFADHAHGDQTRKYTPDKYIVHPVRVMQICLEYTNDITVLAAALLHDVLEDTEVSKEQLTSFLNSLMSAPDRDKTIGLVVELTDIYTKANYPGFNRRKRKRMEVERIAKVSPEAQTIKYADVLDNSTEIIKHDPDFGKRFLEECRDLLIHAQHGNSQLRTRALATVSEGLSSLMTGFSGDQNVDTRIRK